MSSKKFYGVRAGRVPGVYLDWEQCQKQIHGFPNALFKSFPTEEEARSYVATAHSTPSTQAQQLRLKAIADIFVDGSYYKNRYSWAFAVYQAGNLVFSDSGVGQDCEAAKMNNVAGELAAAVKAIEWAELHNLKPITIHHDYMGIAAWAEGSWQAKNKFTLSYAKFASANLSWVQFEKVEGHTGITGNELVDKLAKSALGI